MIKFGLLLVCVLAAWASPTKPGSRIIGGAPARAGQFPFSAAIYINHPAGSFFCGGVIIGDRWILTAGGCVALSLSFTIRIGTNSLSAGSGTLVTSDFFYLPPGFSLSTLANDVGLLRLHMPITFTDYIQPIALPTTPLEDGVAVTTMGWGQISDAEGGLSNSLNYVELVSLTKAECTMVFGSQISENMVCVAGQYNEGTCLGDLGSPLIQYEGLTGVHVVGVSSFISANGCEATDPSGFTQIYPYVDWIRNVTENN